MATEKTLETKKIYQGKVVNLRVDKVLLENGSETTREVIEHQGACAVVAIDDNGRLLMVEQYRYPVEKELFEIPAGKIDPGETPIECAKRELCEETGFVAKELTSLGAIYPVAAYCNEVVHLFLATQLEPAKQNLDSDEILTVHHCCLKEMVEKVMQGEIWDSKTQIGILKAARLLNI